MIFCFVILSFQSINSVALEICSQALVRSQNLSKDHFVDAKVYIKKPALKEASRIGLSKAELEILVLKSQVKSFRKGGDEVLLLFHPLQSSETFRDYVYETKISKKFIPGESKEVEILSFSKLTERREGFLLYDLVDNEGHSPQQFQIENLYLQGLGVPSGSVRIWISAKVGIKILLKHRIDLDILKDVLNQRPTIQRISSRSSEYIELIYRSGQNSLLVVLAKNGSPEVLSLVTAFFFKGELR